MTDLTSLTDRQITERLAVARIDTDRNLALIRQASAALDRLTTEVDALGAELDRREQENQR